MSIAPQLFGQCLVEQGVIAPHQLEEAIHRQQTSMGHRRIGEILVRLNYASKHHVTEGLAAQLGIPIVTLRGREIPPRLVGRVSGVIATTYRVVPVSADGGRLTLAMADPTNLKLLDDLGRLLDCHVEPALSTADDIAWALDRYYGLQDQTVEGLLRDTSVEASVSRLTEASQFTSDGRTRPDRSRADSISTDTISIDMVKKDVMGMADVLDAESPVRRYVNHLIFEAYRQRASDIHVEPAKTGIGIRCRIDGVLRAMPAPPKRAQAAIIACLKIMAGLDITVKRLPQDGRIKMVLCGRDIDLRVSTLPAYSGESVVLRILDKRGVLMGLEELGFSTGTQATWRDLTALSTGVLLVTGPTGSGKTTTLYSSLAELSTATINILTVEDPIEYNLPGIGQTQVNTKADMTFARGLRAILRQDPDVVMVGEIRDLETAEIAVQASLTGHLVMSTLHTNTAVGAVTRLIDMGVEPFLLSSSLVGVLAQRLVRVLCPDCKTMRPANAGELQFLRVPEGRVYDPVGCDQCQGSGYRGRTGVYELIAIDDTMRQLIHDRASELDMAGYARRRSPAIRDDGRDKVLAGVTTVQEVLRVTLED